MRINSLQVCNFRTLADIEVSLSRSYTAICGANDAGKTNVIRALQHLFREGSDRPGYFYRDDNNDISMKDDYTKWSPQEPQDREINISATIAVSQDRDAGLYQFIIKQLSISSPPHEMSLKLAVAYRQEKSEGQVQISVSGKSYDGIDAEQVLNRIRTARCIHFHNSTEGDRFWPVDTSDLQQDLSSQDRASLEKAYKALNTAFGRVAKGKTEGYRGASFASRPAIQGRRFAASI